MNVFFKLKSLLSLVLVLSINTPVFLQLFPNPITLATGQGAIGSLDPIWTCSEWFTALPANPSGATFTPALINNNCAPGHWVDPATLPPPMNNGNWITGQGPNCDLNTISGYRFFRLEIILPPDCNGFTVTEEGNYSLTFSGYVDNHITDVFLNGNSLGISGGGFTAGNQLTITIDGPWQVGVNHIDVLIYNTPGATPTSSNPYGLLLVADATLLNTNDTDNDGISDLFDECPCEVGNNAVGCFDPDFTCDVDLIRTTFENAGCIEMEGCWDDCSMYFLNPQYLSGSAAQAFAQNLGANLVSVHSAEENACILSDLNRLGYGTGDVIWIGFNDEAVEGQFVWYDQSPIVYTNWAPGEPNNSGNNEDCTQIYPGGGNPGTWNDLPCNGSNSMSIIKVNLCPDLDLSPPVEMCLGESATIEVTSTILGSFPYTYSWSNGSSQLSQTVSPTETTDYYVTVTDRYNCQKEESLTVTIFPSTATEAGVDVSVCMNDNVTLTATGASSYVWDNGLGAGASHTFVPIETTTYTVTGTDENGCESTDEVTVTVNPLPAVSATSSESVICLNEQITLVATGATSYVWDNGLGAGASHTIVPTETITYTVVGTDDNGCESTDEVTVTVNPLPAVSATSSENVICLNEQITLVATGATSYVWDNGLGAGASHTIVPTETITYTVVGTDDNGCESTDEVTVTVNPLPAVSATSSENVICLNEQITLVATGATSYVWDNGLGAGTSHTFAPTETTTYTVVGTDDNGCESTDEVTVTVNSLPTATITGAAEICQFDNEPQIVFSGANGNAPYTFVYTINGGSPQTISTTSGNSVTVNVPTTIAGTYTYEVISVQDASFATCADNLTGLTTTIIINPVPTGEIRESKKVCQYEDLTILFEGTNGTGDYIFTYVLNNGVPQTITQSGGGGATVVVPTQTQGVFEYELMNVEDSSTGCNSEQNQLVIIEVLSNPKASFQPNPSELNSYNGTSQMINESTDASYYYWDFGDGYSSSSHSPVHEFSTDETGEYVIMLIAYGEDGLCADTAYQTIQFSNELLFYVPNAFTPDGDEINNVFSPVFTTGYDPNDYTFLIFNRWGELLFESHDVSIGWDGTYNGEVVMSGAYVWRIEVQQTMTGTRETFSGVVNLLR